MDVPILADWQFLMQVEGKSRFDTPVATFLRASFHLLYILLICLHSFLADACALFSVEKRIHCRLL